jgi:hypothetical protein
LRSVEGPRGFASYREAVEASRFLSIAPPTNGGGMSEGNPKANERDAEGNMICPVCREVIRDPDLRAFMDDERVHEKCWREYLARLESGQHNPSLVTLQKLAKALGVPVTELLG